MKLTQRFGPIPVTTTLDGSGNGTVTFQPNGSNARITNLFVKVSTTTAQATCTIYKGQIADGNAVNNTNSGSTGSAASGIIDLTDGEVLYVRWSGGDAGATATATFTGVTIPFDQVGPSHLEWANPIAAGDGSLIYPALKSPNYVAGSAGWKIDRNGNTELSNLTARGALTASSASGAYAKMYADASFGYVEVRPPNSAGTTIVPAQLVAGTNPFSGVPAVRLIGPNIDNAGFSSISLGSGQADGDISMAAGYYWLGSIDGIEFAIDATGQFLVKIAGTTKFQVDGTGNTTISGALTCGTLNALKGERGSVTAGPTAVTSFTQAVSFVTTFPSIPNVHINLNSGAGTTANWHGRAIGVSTTGFTLFGFGPSSTFTASWQWTAVLPTT